MSEQKLTLAQLTAAVEDNTKERRSFVTTIYVKNDDDVVISEFEARLALVPKDPRLAVKLARVETAGEDLDVIDAGLDAIAGFIADMVISWDLEGVAPTKRELEKLPFDVLLALLKGVGKSVADIPKDNLPSSRQL